MDAIRIAQAAIDDTIQVAIEWESGTPGTTDGNTENGSSTPSFMQCPKSKPITRAAASQDSISEPC